MDFANIFWREYLAGIYNPAPQRCGGGKKPTSPTLVSLSLLVENYTLLKIYQVKSYYTIHGEKYNKIYGSEYTSHLHGDFGVG